MSQVRNYVPDFNTLTALTTSTLTSFVVLGYQELTSTSTYTISTSGNVTFLTNLAATATNFDSGVFVTVSSTVDPSNFIQGYIIIFGGLGGHQMSVGISNSGGSGTYSSWKISGQVAYQLSLQQFTDIVNANRPQVIFDMDGGTPSSIYGGIDPIDAGSI